MKIILKIYGLSLFLFMVSAHGFAQGDKASDPAFEEYTKLLKFHKERYAAGSVPVEKIGSERDSAVLAFIGKYPNSTISLKAAEGYIYPIPRTTELRQSARGKNIATIIQNIKNTAIGKIAPDFEQNNTENKPVKLSDYRGKYILLDFWASWCHPCRDENPYLVKAYEQFKDKKFSIISISLDNDRDKWMSAIQEDKLTWTQLSDLGGGSNTVAVLYGVSFIPRNFLIDPDGKIIAKDLRGAGLSKTLEKLCNSDKN
jgi:peroxiredoxin